MANIYFFDPLTALEAAKLNIQVATNLQTYTKQVCFYNGEPYEGMPENCIAVPINDFYNYFLTTTHTLPEHINFDNQNFDDATRNDITQSIIGTLQRVRKERIQIIVKIIQAPLESSTILTFISIILDYLEANDIAAETMEKEVIHYLLSAMNFIQKNNISLEDTFEKRLVHFYKNLQFKTEQQLTTHFKIMNFNFYIHAILSQQTDFKSYFKQLTPFLNNLSAIIEEYDYVAAIFGDENLEVYLQMMQELTLNNEFFNQPIEVQKLNIYKYYFLTNLHFGRGESYREMYHVLKPLFLKALETGQDELAFYLYTPLQMSWNGTAQTQDEMQLYNDEIEKPLEDFIQHKLIKKYQLTPNTRAISKDQKVIKVAFLQERIISYSIHKVFVSLLQALKEYPNTRYEFTIYNLNFMEFGGSDNATVDALKAIGFNYVDLHQEYVGNENAFYPIIEKALHTRQRIIDDNIDILIGMHSRPEYNFLFTTRTAPKQIYWSHGNFEYHINNIDVKLHHTIVPKLYTSFYQTFSNPITLDKYNPRIDINLIKNTRKLFPENKFILGSIGRLVKLDDLEYLTAVSKIMKRNPDTIYLACGSGSTSNIESMLQGLGIHDRFYFTGHVDSHIYGHVIDLWLTPFKFGGGEALQEYMYKGQPFVIKSDFYEEIVSIHKSKDKDICTRILNKDDKTVLSDIYDNDNINMLKKYHYLYEENKDFATFLGLTTVKTTEAFINVANLLIKNKHIREKIGKEVLFDAKLKNEKATDNFIKTLNEV